MVKNIFTLIFFSFSFSQNPNATLTSDQIQKFGLKRFGDVLTYFRGIQTSSIDGFDIHSAHITGNISFFIDDEPITVDVFTSNTINRLPLILTEVERIEFYSSPVVINGVVASDGALLFYKKRNQNALSFSVESAIYNEVGDPGPYRYTEKYAPNVDHHGPDLNSYLNYNYDSLSISLSGQFLEHRPLDERIQNTRDVPYSFSEWPDITMFQGNLDVRYKLKNHSFTAVSSHTLQDDFVHSYMEGWGFPEKEMTHTVKHHSVRGNSRVFQTNMQYGVQMYQVESENETTVFSQSRYRSYLNANWNEYTIFLENNVSEYDTFDLNQRFTSSEIGLSYSEQRFLLTYFQGLGSQEKTMIGQLNYSNYTVDFSYQNKQSDRYEVLSKYRPWGNIFNVSLSKEYQLNPFLSSFIKFGYYSNTKQLYIEKNAEKLNTQFKIYNTHTVLHSMSYRKKKYSLSSSVLWRSAIQTDVYEFPKYEIDMHATYHPFSDISLISRIIHYGKRASVNRFTAIDLGVMKTFWKKRGRVHLLIKNALDQKIMTDPIGRTENLSFEMTLSLAFNGNSLF